MASTIRGMVSKKKKRFDKDGFDLDLSYITPQIIAMGFPSTGMEAAYRNPLPEVQRFFNTRHKGAYKVYNLCAERGYELKSFFDNTERVPFKDHNPCQLDVILPFCQSVHKWLASNPRHVVGVHCKAGKGRTGLMICCYLLYSREVETAKEALAMFARLRTHDGKGVTIPSQIRYVHYFAHQLKHGFSKPLTYRLAHIRMLTIPNFDYGGGCDPYFTVSVNNDPTYGMLQIYSNKKTVTKARPSDKIYDLDVSRENILISGNVKFQFLDWDRGASDDKMFHFWIHTGYISRGYLAFRRSTLDGAVKDKKNKHFHPDFKLELFFTRVEMDPASHFRYALDLSGKRRKDDHRFARGGGGGISVGGEHTGLESESEEEVGGKDDGYASYESESEDDAGEP